MNIIGIFSIGYGSGKDSVANVLALRFGYTILGFSEVMKVQLWNELTHNKFPTLALWLEYCESHKYDQVGDDGFWVRTLLKGYGQYYRSINPDYWINTWWLEVLDKGQENIAVPNVRFPNEATRIKALGGPLVKVVRPGISVDNDPSEISMKNWTPDYTIFNDGTLLELSEQVSLFMRDREDLCPTTTTTTTNQLVQEKLT